MKKDPDPGRNMRQSPPLVGFKSQLYSALSIHTCCLLWWCFKTQSHEYSSKSVANAIVYLCVTLCSLQGILNHLSIHPFIHLFTKYIPNNDSNIMSPSWGYSNNQKNYIIRVTVIMELLVEGSVLFLFLNTIQWDAVEILTRIIVKNMETYWFSGGYCRRFLRLSSSQPLESS